MPNAHRSRPPRRSNAEYRWSRLRIHAFLRALAVTGSVAAAARVVGMSRQSAYRLRRRLGVGFAEVWDEGLRLGARMRRAGPGEDSGPARPSFFTIHVRLSSVENVEKYIPP